MYYSRKFVIYNFIIFDVVFKEIVCNMWWEIIVKWGSCEIVFCFLDYNKSVGFIDELVYYLDSCIG